MKKEKTMGDVIYYILKKTTSFYIGACSFIIMLNLFAIAGMTDGPVQAAVMFAGALVSLFTTYWIATPFENERKRRR